MLVLMFFFLQIWGLKMVHSAKKKESHWWWFDGLKNSQRSPWLQSTIEGVIINHMGICSVSLSLVAV